MTWPAERKLYRRNRRLDSGDIAILCVAVVGSMILYFFGA